MIGLMIGGWRSPYAYSPLVSWWPFSFDGLMFKARFTLPQDRIGWANKGQQSSKFWSKQPDFCCWHSARSADYSRYPAVSTRISNFVDLCWPILSYLLAVWTGFICYGLPLNVRWLIDLKVTSKDQDIICLSCWGDPRQIDQGFTPPQFWFCWNCAIRVISCPGVDGHIAVLRSMVFEI